VSVLSGSSVGAGEIDPNRRISLNVLWTDGERMVGSRLNRTLWYLEQDGPVLCEICGQSHVHHSPKQHYRGVEIASEPMTHERWLQIPNGTVFSVDPDFRLNIFPLSAEQSRQPRVRRRSRPSKYGLL
jgi:hypothetical protein